MAGEQTILSRVRTHDALIVAASARHGVPASLVRAVIAVESGGDPQVKRDEWRKDQSGKQYLWDTSKGLMQLLTSTALGLGWNGRDDLYDPAFNVNLGTKYLAELHATAEKQGHAGSWAWAVALARYNGGSSGNPRADGTLRNASYVGKVLKYVQEQQVPSFTRTDTATTRPQKEDGGVEWWKVILIVGIALPLVSMI